MRTHQAANSTVEPLENRTLFSAAVVAHSVLRVVAPSNAMNTVTVADSADGTAVEVSIHSVNGRGVTKDFNASYPKSLGFQRVHVRGGVFADTITVGSESAPFTMSVRIDAKSGNDTITGGAGDDILVGGVGDDTIHAGGGNDVVFGKQGNDTIFGEDGDDVIWGGAGDDTEDGGAGDDKLGGIVGTNTLTGGAGHDEFVAMGNGLAGNPSNDFNAAEDVLTLTKKKDDGNKSPAI